MFKVNIKDTRTSMTLLDWSLYDNGLRHERVNFTHCYGISIADSQQVNAG